MDGIFAKISSRENISNSIWRKFPNAKIKCYTVVEKSSAEFSVGDL